MSLGYAREEPPVPPKKAPSDKSPYRPIKFKKAIQPIAKALFTSLKNNDPSTIGHYLPTAEDLKRHLDRVAWEEEHIFRGMDIGYGTMFLQRIKEGGGVDRVVMSARKELTKNLESCREFDTEVPWQKLRFVSCRLDTKSDLSHSLSVAGLSDVPTVLRVEADGSTWDIEFEIEAVGERVCVWPRSDWLHAPLAKAGPATRGVRLVFGLESKDERDIEILTPRVLATLRHRVDRLWFRGVSVKSPKPGIFHVNCVRSIKSTRVLERIIPIRGAIRFQIEVLPAEVLKQRRHDDQATSRLDSGNIPWQGAGKKYPATKEGFDAFKKKEIEHWKIAKEKGLDYSPVDPRYLLVPMLGRMRIRPEDFRVVEVPTSGVERFGSKDLKGTANLFPQFASPVPAVLYEVRTESQDAFFKFTSKNIGMPMAILIDGVCISAPVIRQGLRDNVMITMGTELSELDKARELAAALSAGELEAPLKLQAIENQ